MPKFSRKKAIVLTWNQTSCKTARIRREGSGIAVEAVWSGDVSKEQSLATLLVDGYKAVGGDENSFTIASGDGGGWGSADLMMPQLKGAELRNALGFELIKQTPIPAERVRWGFRRLPPVKDQGNEVPVRLIYVRQDKWTQWLSALEGIRHLDLICPPAAALAPLGDEGPVFLPDSEGVVHRHSREEGQWLSSPDELPADFDMRRAIPSLTVVPGPLASLPAVEQAAWMPAVVLGAYALTEEADEDIATLVPLPEEKRPHRNTFVKGLALKLLIYILLVCVFALIRQLQVRNAHLRRIALAQSEVDAKLSELRAKNKPANVTFGATLRQEMQESLPQGPDIPEVLAEISRIVTPPAWISQKFEWNAGLVTLQVQSPVKDADLVLRLEESPLLGDVREQSSAFRVNAYITRYTMNARYDTPEEAAALQAKRQEQAAEAARRREAEAKAKAEQAEAQDDMAVDDFGEDEDDPAGLINDEEIIIP